ncbi:MAG: hypothetical protein ACOYMA_17910 [Bacteroidia bacterium]
MNRKQIKIHLLSLNFFVVFCSIFLLNIKAQNQFGLTTGNYSGLHNLQINPANICFQPVTYELNIVGADGFINNNNFFTNATFVPKLPFNNNYTRLRLKNHNYKPDSLKPGNLLLFSDIQSNGYVFGGVNVLGPSILFALSRKKSMAITTGFRTHLSATNINSFGAQAVFEGLSFNPIKFQQMKMENTKISIGSWSEIGLSYAQVINDNRNYTHRLGISVKALLGILGGYAYDKGFNGRNETGSQLIFDNSNFSYAYSGPATNDKLKNTSSKDIALRGIGASFDIGYSIQKNPVPGTRYCPNLYQYGNNTKAYNWKAGISFLDIGAIQYFKNSFATNIINGSLVWGKFDTIVIYDITAIDATLRSYVGAEHTQTFKKFWLILPSAVSLQYDYNINSIFFVNATIVQRITLANMPSLSRMNSVAIIPRYETEELTVCMPFILNEYKDINLGLAIRYKHVTIGSDRFGETFGLQNIYGANFYFAFKYSLINKKIFWKKIF